MEKAIRVLVANRPRLMREVILATFADQPDIEIVGEVTEESEISESVKRTLPNFVVIALEPKNNYIVYYWASLDIHSNNIEASEEGILSAMRTRMVANGAN